MNALARFLAVSLIAIAPARAASPLEGPLVGLWMMGQSLCDGSESLPIVTPNDTGWGNYAFARGVRTWVAGDNAATPENRPFKDFAFVPLTAKQNGGLGETIANGLADHLKFSLLRPNSNAATRIGPPRLLVAYAGQGGRTIGELSDADESTDPRTPKIKQGGGGYYRTSLDDARRAVQQAKARGQTFKIAALIWMQGEANGGPTGGIVPHRWAEEIPAPRGQEWYRDQLIAYRKKWSDDLRAITGQQGDIPMFTYQTQGPAGYAQLQAAAKPGSEIYMVGPHYAVPSAVNSRTTNGRYGAAIHLSADGERWYGEQVAKAIRRTLAEREHWKPLQPRTATLADSRREILVHFHVPRPPLVLETSFFPREQSPLGAGFGSLAGFQVRTAKGEVRPLASVEIAAPDQVKLHLTEPLPAGAEAFLGYGFPYAGQLGAIAEIRPGPVVSTQPTTELRLTGPFPAPQKSLLAEGAFYVTNSLNGQSYAQALIRLVTDETGAAILRFENRELRNDVPFAVGQTLTALRPFSYGNLRDSDPEPAVYRFTDPAYGTRQNQLYPLWNWCVLFDYFPISAPPAPSVPPANAPPAAG